MGIYWVLLVVFHVTVLIHTGHSFCEVKIEKEHDFVVFGEAAFLNCTSNCTRVLWETRLNKLSTNRIAYFSSVKVNVSDWKDSPIKCLAISAEGNEKTAVVRVLPYVLPSKVDIYMKKELEENVEHSVTCSVYDVAPMKYVMVAVTRGGDIFQSKTYEEDIREGEQTLAETFSFTANRNDNLQDFACEVTLNLTRVTNRTVQSSPVTVRTYALPNSPRITAEKWMEHGKVIYISCEVLQGFPKENITTKLYVDGYPNTMTLGNVSVSSALNTSDLPLGQYSLICVSQVYSFSKESTKRIYVYEHPNVTFTLSKKVINLHDTVTVSCGFIRGSSEYFGLSISVDGQQTQRENATELTDIITPRTRKPNVSITCEAFIHDNNQVLLTREETLTVHYPPEFSDNSCPTSIIWVEEENRLFGCRSEGNPTPEEVCRFNNVSLPSTTSFTAERSMSGSYTCQASNSIGTVTKSVEVTVQYPPGPTTVDISTSSVTAGGSVNLTCHSDALPPPEYSWIIPLNAQVDYTEDKRSIAITKASSYHNGTYICEAKNKHGPSRAKQDLEVISDNTTLWAALIAVAVVLCLAVVIGLVSRCLLQNGKKGFYDLVRRKAGNPQNSEVPLQEKSTV